MKIINLKRREDRKQQMEISLSKFNLKYEFYEAIDAKQLEPNEYIYKLFSRNDFNWRKTFIACALSHYNIWNSMVNEYCLILEDDVRFSDNFEEELIKCQHFIETTPDVDFLFLGYTVVNREHLESPDQLTFQEYCSDLYIGGFFGYIITKSGVEKMQKYISKNGIRHGIDYLIKINSDLNIYECQPMIVKSEYVKSFNSQVDTDIQKNFESFSFEYSDISNTAEMITIDGEQFHYFPGLDSMYHDIERVPFSSLTDIVKESRKHSDFSCFNSLGFLKRRVDRICTSSYIQPNHGLYVKIQNKIRVKMMCNWCSSEKLCHEWNHMSKGNFIWNDIQITSSDENIDYYVIINYPKNNDFYIPEKTIIFHMEPWCKLPEQKWGVKTWGKWARPDETKFLQVRTHDKYYNNATWQFDKTYSQLKEEKIEKNNSTILSTICGPKYFDPGHIQRIDFLKFLEQRNDPSVLLHLYTSVDKHGFKSYKGPLPDNSKNTGMLPYKYYFMGENNIEHNYISEKFWEPIVAETLCFYWGAPNASEYINPKAFVQLDLTNFEKSFNMIKDAIENNLWEQRIDIIRDEKEKILEYYGFFPTLERIIKNN